MTSIGLRDRAKCSCITQWGQTKIEVSFELLYFKISNAIFEVYLVELNACIIIAMEAMPFEAPILIICES